jgi:hypothetical protein
MNVIRMMCLYVCLCVCADQEAGLQSRTRVRDLYLQVEATKQLHAATQQLHEAAVQHNQQLETQVQQLELICNQRAERIADQELKIQDLEKENAMDESSNSSDDASTSGSDSDSETATAATANAAKNVGDIATAAATANVNAARTVGETAPATATANVNAARIVTEVAERNQDNGKSEKQQTALFDDMAALSPKFASLPRASPTLGSPAHLVHAASVPAELRLFGIQSPAHALYSPRILASSPVPFSLSHSAMTSSEANHLHAKIKQLQSTLHDETKRHVVEVHEIKTSHAEQLRKQTQDYDSLNQLFADKNRVIHEQTHKIARQNTRITALERELSLIAHGVITPAEKHKRDSQASSSASQASSSASQASSSASQKRKLPPDAPQRSHAEILRARYALNNV